MTRVIVGLSGGVDSSVAALLLKQQGFQVEALFMKNWTEDDSDRHCPAAQDYEDAQKVCERLQIPLHHVNFSKEYWDNVFEHCLNEFHKGNTPNPDILCNREIKFNVFLQHALELGADFIATGHYAQIEKRDGRYELVKALDKHKDQTYFLYTLNQKALSKTLFPIGHLNKKEVREIAKRYDLSTSEKKDSTGICFIGERNFKQFLSQYLPKKPGPMVTTEGQSVGKHDGLCFYTIGQRSGLGIGGQAGCDSAPWYVVAKDIPNNTLVVTQGHDHPLLFRESLKAHDLHWITSTPDVNSLHCQAKIRYGQTEVPCKLTLTDQTSGQVIFETPQRAITPGQSVVFYQQQQCLGGGVIH